MSLPTLLRQARSAAQSGRLDRAIANAERALREHPGNAEAGTLLGFLLVQAGRAADAVAVLSRVAAAAPGQPGPLNDLANALVHDHRPAEAVARWREALRCDLAYLPAYFGLADACAQAGDAAAAVAAADEGLLLRPGWPELELQRATALEAAGRLEEALAALDQLAARDPRQTDVLARRITVLHYLDRPAAEHTRALQAYAAAIPAPPPPPVVPARAPAAPFRLGVISADLRTHSVGYFFSALAEHLPADWTLTVYSTLAVAKPDPLRERFRARATHWREIATLPDPALDALLRSDQIDVLVDLAGHFAGNRLRALDRRPVPVVVTALGYPGSTGHPAVGWRLVDATTDPAGAEARATERLWRLDPCFLAYTPPADAPEPALPPPAQPFTFGCFNLTNKISDRCITLWSQVLQAVPGAHLLLKSGALADAGVQRHLRDRMARGGVDPARLRLLPFAPTQTEHLACYRQVHVAMDTFPYSGTTTTCEALWMGVPVLTLPGERHASRVTASLLQAAGCGEWIAESPEAYVAAAVRLAGEPARIAAFRAGARAQLRASPLLDAAGYAERVFRGLRTLVETQGAACGSV